MIMAPLAQRLPVLFIPEQRIIPAMGNDMVNHGRWHQVSRAKTRHAQRMLAQKACPRTLPFCIVTSLRGVFTSVKGAVFCTVNTVR
jgi:hypothetical protein